MTDAELAKYLGIDTWPEWQKAVAIICPAKRAIYERMAKLEVEITLWQEGLGPKPTRVLIDMAKTPKRAKKLVKRLQNRARNHITTGVVKVKRIRDARQSKGRRDAGAQVEIATLRDLLENRYRETDKARAESDKADE